MTQAALEQQVLAGEQAKVALDLIDEGLEIDDEGNAFAEAEAEIFHEIEVSERIVERIANFFEATGGYLEAINAILEIADRQEREITALKASNAELAERVKALEGK